MINGNALTQQRLRLAGDRHDRRVGKPSSDPDGMEMLATLGACPMMLTP